MPKPAFLTNDPNPRESFARQDRNPDRIQSGPIWLKDPRIADIIVSALIHGDRVRACYDLFSWVVMPNHVQAVLKPHQHLPEIMRWLKAATAIRANRLLRRSGAPFWQREYYDHWVRSEKEFFSIVDYVEQNPVVAGLAASPEDWPWSSAWERRRQGPPAPQDKGGIGVVTTVVAGVLERDGNILIGRRRADQPHPLKWEFPGGKLEADESPAAALIRELREELGIESEAGPEIMRYEFAYPGKSPILLIFLSVSAWHGNIENRIFETILWEPRAALSAYDFLEGDARFLTALSAQAGGSVVRAED